MAFDRHFNLTCVSRSPDVSLCDEDSGSARHLCRHMYGTLHGEKLFVSGQETVLITCLLATASALIVLYVAGIVRAVFRWHRANGCTPLAHLLHMRDKLAFTWAGIATSTSPMEDKIFAAMAMLRSRRFTHLAKSMRHPLALVMLAEIVSVRMEWNQAGEVRDAIYGEEFTAVLLIFSLYNFFANFSAAAETKLLDAAHFCIVISLLKHLYFSNTSHMYLYRHGWITNVRISMAMFARRNASMTMGVNTLFTFVDIKMFGQLTWQQRLDIATLHKASMPPPGYLVREFGTLLTIFAVVFTLDAQYRSEVRSSLETLQVKMSSSSVLQILCSLCDAVVELDSDLAIKNHSRSLAALLLQCRERDSHTGRRFADFIHKDDKEKYEAYILHGSHSGSTPQISTEPASLPPLHLSMRDSCGSVFPAQVLVSSFEDMTGKLNHFVGIIECGQHETVASLDGQTPVVNRFGRFQRSSASPDGQVVIGNSITAKDGDETSSTRLSHESSQTGSRRHRKKRGGLHQSWQGTPADKTQETLDGDPSFDEISLASSNASRRSLSLFQPVFPDYVLTKECTKIYMLLEALTSCNVERRSIACCSFHILVNDARQTLRDLMKLPCERVNPRPWQCQNCGVCSDADMDDGCCELCHLENARRIGQTSL